jgi:hypothetical protein
MLLAAVQLRFQEGLESVEAAFKALEAAGDLGYLFVDSHQHGRVTGDCRAMAGQEAEVLKNIV